MKGFEYTYIPATEKIRTWTIRDIGDGREFGVYTNIDIIVDTEIWDTHYLLPFGGVGMAITELGRFINHSVEPNCIAKLVGTRYILFSLRDITSGEELVCDYKDYSETKNIEEPKKEWE